MKIALIGRYGEGEILSGPERVARELYQQLKEKNTNITFVEYFFGGYSDYSLFNKIFGKKIKDDSVLRLGIISLIIKLLKEQFEIIHFVNSQRFSLIIFFLKPFLKAKFISNFHGLNKAEIKESELKRTFLDLWVEKLSLKKSAILVFPSKLLISLFRQHYNFSEGKCRVIHNGITEVFIKNKIQFNNKEVYNFVYYNSFGKGLKEILAAIPELIDFQLRIFVIGQEEKINTLKKNIKVNFIEPMNQSSLAEFLSDIHFVIKSSTFDSFSIFTAECMVAGIIPVVSESTGIKELIENNVNGFVYNKENLALLLRDIYEGKFNLIEISQNASKIYEKLNWENVSEQYISLYKSVL